MSPPHTTTVLHHLLTILLLTTTLLHHAHCGTIGINYGRIANNLPPPSTVSTLTSSLHLPLLKIYDSDPTVLRSFSNSSSSAVSLTVSLPNELLRSAALRPNYATIWLRRNILPFLPSTPIRTIAVGNEVFADPHNTTAFLVPALRNLHSALVRLNLNRFIKLSSPIALSALGNSYPPSAGAFRSDIAEGVVKPMLEFLKESESSLMVNAYPIFAYQANSDVISLDYALFRENPGVVDEGSGLRYFSLFDAQIDAVFSAMHSLGFDDIPIVVTETGWPSKGDSIELGASVENAAAYNGNLVKRVLTRGGTPLRPKADLTVYLFALFNENKKPGPTSERNYGLFYPNLRKVYSIPLTMEDLKREEKGGKKGEIGSPEEGGKGKGKGTGKVTVSGETWCVAKDEIGEMKLQGGLDYACGEGGADCTKIQPGAACFNPNTLVAHASYAFNSYYQKSKRVQESCDFEGAAVVVDQPPNFANGCSEDAPFCSSFIDRTALELTVVVLFKKKCSYIQPLNFC